MALGRMGVGVAVLLALAGPALAQPFSSLASGMTGPPQAPPAYLPVQVPDAAGIPMPMPGSPASAVIAEDHPPVKELPSGLPDLVPPPEHGAHAGGHAEHDEIPGYMTPFVPGHSGWYTQGEYLLMRPRDTNFDYAIQGSGPASGLQTVGPIQSLRYGMGNGLRFEVGRRLGEHGLWDVGFGYTYFRATQGDNAGFTAPTGGALFPTLTRPGLTDRVLTASATADLNYNIYDIIVGRRILVDDHLALRLFGGGRFADVQQQFNAYYDGGDARLAAVRSRSRFDGFGPMVGLEAVLAGWKGFHLYTRATGGLISGRSNNGVIEVNDGGATTYVNTAYDVRKVVPMTSIALGVGWQYRTFFIRGGYEIAHWQGIFERPRFVDDVSQGKIITRPSNLTLEGLFLQVGLNF